MTQPTTRGPVARARIARLVDGGSFEEIDRKLNSRNFLQFEGYEQKIEQARLRSRETEAVVTGFAHIGGHACMLGVMEPEFMMGTLGVAAGEKLARLFEAAMPCGEDLESSPLCFAAFDSTSASSSASSPVASSTTLSARESATFCWA